MKSRPPYREQIEYLYNAVCYGCIADSELIQAQIIARTYVEAKRFDAKCHYCAAFDEIEFWSRDGKDSPLYEMVGDGAPAEALENALRTCVPVCQNCVTAFQAANGVADIDLDDMRS